VRKASRISRAGNRHLRRGSERCDFIQQNIWGTERGMLARMACKSFGFNLYGRLGATKQTLPRTLLNSLVQSNP
jgi:hypothetical protein